MISIANITVYWFGRLSSKEVYKKDSISHLSGIKIKDALLLFLTLLVPVLLKAQYSRDVISGPTPQYVYVGSLSYESFDSSNFEKLKVDVFGGAWESDANGETTYFIANRNGLVVNQNTLGSGTGERFTLKAYKNGNTKLDFYLVTREYTSFAVKSCLLSGNQSALRLVDITVSSNPPQLAEVPINITTVLMTDAVGNVGIGTANPSAKLTVAGNIESREVKVSVDAGADYVFNDHYSLPSLSEVEDYVKKNQHLPDIASAQKMEAEGVNLSEMNIKLLKKIEELTLYIIEQDKKNTEQDKLIRKLVSRDEQLQDAIRALRKLRK
ncbi:hypothetical protein [Pararcticibacter amylolyticus]|uniref:Uncharacterized protein n=1 Tax=Pararcticibacter amylolyticus TaxID=2173175 RepID=A0A2U2P9M3_9SPHI|nr:hypothetical protein [Pararcticibacter amylolyticus]PWG78073.1 hypothetical protein DDR33_24180 [Pararcticibacter amylolyticus]